MKNNLQYQPLFPSDYVSIFSENDWMKLDRIVHSVLTQAPDIFEYPVYGDSRNEKVKLRVARFIVRKNGFSEIVNEFYTSQILSVFLQSAFIEHVEKKTNLKKLNILRMQLNVMEADSLVGIHTDKESDGSFEVTSVIRTHSLHSGGELCIYENVPKIIHQKNHTVFLMDSNLEHEVKTVQTGLRNSLIILLGKSV